MHYPSAWWWAQSMRDAVAVRWGSLTAGGLPRGLRVDSCCAGLGTERIACKTLGIPMVGGVVSEPKKEAASFLIENGLAVDHLVENMSAHCRPEAFCERHGKTCRLHDGDRPDVLVVGPPCQPFSILRHDAAKSGPEKHPLFSLTMGGGEDPHDNVPSVVRAVRPRSLLMEQVEGFARGSAGDTSYLGQFLGKLLAIQSEGKQLFDGVRLFFLNPGVWLNISRPRPGLAAQAFRG